MTLMYVKYTQSNDSETHWGLVMCYIRGLHINIDMSISNPSI